MTSTALTAAKKRAFFGWWIVGAGFFIQALNGGIYFYGFSAFFNPLIDEFAWSRTELSGAFSLSRLESGIAAPIVGFLLDRFGPRKLMLVGITVVSLGFFLISRVDSLFFFYAVFLLISIGAAFGFGGPVNTAVANWFVKKRSLALGITSCGNGLGGAGVTALSWVIITYGWRTGSITAGAIFLFLALPLALFMRHKPEQYGCLPDGASPDAASASGESQKRNMSTLGGQEEASFTAKQALLTSTFWMLSVVFGVRAMVTSGIAVHEIPHLIDIGYSPEVAASILGVMTIISILGRLGFGWLADRFDKRYIIASCLVLQCVGLLIFANISSFWMVVGFLVIFSPAYGGLIPLIPSSWGHYFGRQSFATIQGLGQLTQMVATISGPLIAGYTFDATGSYQIAFMSFAFLNILGIVLVFMVRKPKLKATLASEAAS